MAASGLILSPSAIENPKASPLQHRFGHSKPVEKPIQVLVTTPSANFSLMPLEVSKVDIIESVKILIKSFKGFYVDQQRLVYGGRELIQDERLVQEQCASGGDGSIQLVLRLSDVTSITVEASKGGPAIYTVQHFDRTKDLQKHNPDKEGGLQHSQPILTLKGERLANSTAIEDLSLDEEAVLYLFVQKPIKLKSTFVGKTGVELVMTTPEVISPQESVIQKTNVYFPPQITHDEGVMGLRKAFPLRSHSTTQLSKLSIKEASPLRSYSSIHLSNLPIKAEPSDSLRDLLEHVRMGLHAGQSPKLTPEGSGGVYLMKDECGMQNIAVFKPMDEEPMALNNPRGFSSSYGGEGLKKGTRSGEGAIREVAAYILDHPAQGRRCGGKKDQQGFAGVPLTAMVRCFHEAFKYHPTDDMLYRKPKLGSLQQHIHALSSCEDMGSSMFPVEEVHKITVLDLRLANTDRHGGNILVCKGNDDALKLVPIDHGYCLPDKFEECTFEWLYWPQARQPYSASTLKYINSLDAEQDIALLQLHGWNLLPRFARVLHIATMVLKKGAVAGLTPFDIGSIISRVESPDMKSPIECIIEEVESKRPKEMIEEAFLKVVEELLDNLIAQMKTV